MGREKTGFQRLLVLLVVFGLIVGLNSFSFAAGSNKTLKVPSEYKTIQAAIDAASSGDAIQAAAGKYQENIILKEGVILQGAGADATTIDGNGKGNVVEGAKGAVIEGFTITNSGKRGTTGDIMDVGISAKHAPMTIANCRIIGNNAGIRTYFSPSNIINNIVADNRVYGLYILYSDSSVKNNIVYNNGSYGVYNSYSTPEVINNTIFKNFDGIYSEVSKVVVKNNIVVNNKSAGIRWAEFPDAQKGTGFMKGVEPILSYNLVWGNKTDRVNVSPAEGDISKDPLFTDIAKGDVRLKKGSPAINNGSPDNADNDPDATRNDIGAYGGPLAQKTITASPQAVSYASLKIKTETLEEPDYGSQSTWSGAGGTKSGRGLFQSWCVSCHGALGKGDGQLADTLGEGIRPRDLSNAELLSARSDEFLFKVIKNGGPSVGFSDAMMNFGATLSDEEIKNIIAYVRKDICKCQYKGVGGK
ncbi:MAG: right-handed parallel beta-helix repeat-containing protein [Deltaproteobacteria bacterium]|nr:right-handed parallel beta-helix repeat-containing protein [Deltaproteobacteria bacterium]